MTLRTRTTLAILGSAALSISLLVAEPIRPRPRAEFALEQPDDEDAAGPNAFLVRHAAQQGFPFNVDESFRAAATEKAFKSFERIRFRGLSKGRRGVWSTVGPVSMTAEFDYQTLPQDNISGRVTDLALAGDCTPERCRLFLASAGGGLWRTDRALDGEENLGWRHLGGLPTNAIGAITVDANDPAGNTLYVGTGETNLNFTSGAGKGLFRSTDGGETFTRIPTSITDLDVSPGPLDFTATRGISQVAVRPGAPGTIYVATTTAMMGMTSVRGGQSTITGGPQAKVGLYRTTDGGATWELLFDTPVDPFNSGGTPAALFERASGVKDVQLDPLDPGTVYLTVLGDGIYRSSAALDGDTSFRKVFGIVGTPTQSSLAMFDLTVKDGTTRIYAYNGNDDDFWAQALYRVDDANVPTGDLHAGGVNSAAWLNLTSTDISQPGAFASLDICEPQCTYDLVVAVPDGRPDTVYLGGNWTAWLGDPTVRSTDAGATFRSFGIDTQLPPNLPHVDVRAIAFHPTQPEIVFIGSDGGLVRSDGTYGDAGEACGGPIYNASPGGLYDNLCRTALAEVPTRFYFLNRGLQTMQLFNISADPSRPLRRMMAGTQDNSTQWFDGSQSAKVWSQLFGWGDGTSANGFHPTNPKILFASYQNNWFFTHFEGGDEFLDWTVTAGPIRYSNERSSPVSITGRQFMTFDPIAPDTQYVGYEHLWRTKNNGGDRTHLELHCNMLQVFWISGLAADCGDWVPLGENLVDATFGDRDGGVVVAAERSKGDAGTLWAATSNGRLFITKNVDAEPASDVAFVRLDSVSGGVAPERFVSGIAVDPASPNRAFVSYSGFNALTPATPGHVFQVVYDPSGGTATFTSLDHNLGDLPVNHLVRDDPKGDLYAATDFGVLTLLSGRSSWEIAAKGLPVVLTPHLEIHPTHRQLFAATHGLGAWYLNLPK